MLVFKFDNPYYVEPPPEPVDEPDESQKRIVGTGGDWNGSYEYLYFETTSDGRYLYELVQKGSNDFPGYTSDIKYDPSDGKFYDVGTGNPAKWGIDDSGTNLTNLPTSTNMQTHYWYNDAGDTLKFQFDNPFYVAVEPEPVDEPDESQKRFVATGGGWYGFNDYFYFGTTSQGRYLYGLVEKGLEDRNSGSDQWDVEYDPSDKKFYDLGTSHPAQWSQYDTGNLAAFPTDPNLETQYWYDSSGGLRFQFTNPYYVAPLPEPEESNKRLVATGGQYDGTFEWLYFSTTPEGNFVYGLVETNSSVRYSPTNYDFEFNPSDGKFYDSGSSYPAKWCTDANATGLSVFPTTANMQTLFWYNESGDTLIFQFDNVFYEAPPPPDPVMRLVATGGIWEDTNDFFYFETTSEARYRYGMVEKGDTNRLNGDEYWDIDYDPSNGKWYDVGPSQPDKWSTDNTGTNITAFPTDPNMPIHYWYHDNGTFYFQFDNPYYVAPPAPEPGYKYLAFYGRSGTSNGWFYELELTTNDGLIDYNNPVPLITVVGTVLDSDSRWNNPSCIFDGQYTQEATETLVFDPNVIGVLFYMENSSRIEVQSGSYYTYDSQGSSAILSGAIYGTNTDPTTFDATDESNWDYVCDLTVISETPDPPPEPVERLVATGGSFGSTYDYYYYGTTTLGRYLYALVEKGSTIRVANQNDWDVEYDPSDSMFYDVGHDVPNTWGIDTTGTNLTSFPTATNMQTHYWYYDGTFMFQFNNPYYLA